MVVIEGSAIDVGRALKTQARFGKILGAERPEAAILYFQVLYFHLRAVRFSKYRLSHRPVLEFGLSCL
jgi:hypothetical protein